MKMENCRAFFLTNCLVCRTVAVRWVGSYAKSSCYLKHKKEYYLNLIEYGIYTCQAISNVMAWTRLATSTLSSSHQPFNVRSIMLHIGSI